MNLLPISIVKTEDTTASKIKLKADILSLLFIFFAFLLFLCSIFLNFNNKFKYKNIFINLEYLIRKNYWTFLE